MGEEGELCVMLTGFALGRPPFSAAFSCPALKTRRREESDPRVELGREMLHISFLLALVASAGVWLSHVLRTLSLCLALLPLVAL